MPKFRRFPAPSVSYLCMDIRIPSKGPQAMKIGKRKLTCQKHPHRGFSLLEMVAAAVLMTSILAPSLTVMRDAMAQSREMNTRNLLATFAVQKLEEQASVSMRTWNSTTEENNFAAYGHPEIGFNTSMSDNPADGGIVGQLMHIQVTVFDDRNSDLIPNTGEIQVQFRTKVAKLNTYENEEQ